MPALQHRPCFFLSHARRDASCGAYLKTFFDDLVDAISRRGAISRKQRPIGFRDQDGIQGGNDWSAELAAALQRAHCMVALYSPFYFESHACGREFQVLLDRQGVELQDGVATNSRYIIPVLWERKEDLRRLNFPHRVTEQIQLAGGEHTELIAENGVRRLLQRRNEACEELIDELAGQILDFVVGDPLPPAEEAPSFRSTRSAFHADEARGGEHEPLGPSARLDGPGEDGVVIGLCGGEPEALPAFDTARLRSTVRLASSPEQLDTMLDALPVDGVPCVVVIGGSATATVPGWLTRVLPTGRVNLGLIVLSDEPELSARILHALDDRVGAIPLSHCEPKDLQKVILSMMWVIRKKTILGNSDPTPFPGDGPDELPLISGPEPRETP